MEITFKWESNETHEEMIKDSRKLERRIKELESDIVILQEVVMGTKENYTNQPMSEVKKYLYARQRQLFQLKNIKQTGQLVKKENL